MHPVPLRRRPDATRRGRDDGLRDRRAAARRGACRHSQPCSSSPGSSSTWSRVRTTTTTDSTSSTPASSSTATSCGSGAPPAGKVDAIRLTHNGPGPDRGLDRLELRPTAAGDHSGHPPAEPGRSREPVHLESARRRRSTRRWPTTGSCRPRTRAGSSTSTSCSTHSTPTPAGAASPDPRLRRLVCREVVAGQRSRRGTSHPRCRPTPGCLSRSTPSTPDAEPVRCSRRARRWGRSTSAPRSSPT